MSVKLTTAYWKIRALKKKIRIIQGSQGAAKTFSILTRIFEQAYNGDIKKATIVTETYPQLKDGAISDMKSICSDAGFDFDKNYNKSDKDLRVKDALIQFRNADNKDFHKSKGVRRDILFVNEGNRTGWSSIDQMLTRSKVIYVDYNPDAEFWVHEHLISRDDADFIILTYLDNEMLSEEEREEIETRIRKSEEPNASKSLKEWVRVYAKGQLGTYSDRQIYSFDIIDEIPNAAKRINSGMDFGVSPDPTVLIDCFIEGANLYCDEIFSENNLLPEKLKGAERMSIVDKLDEVEHLKGHKIIADSAGKTEITDIRKHGYNIKGVKKTTGSVILGINKVRGYNLFITKRSLNLKKGAENWHFKVDHNGKIVPEPDGHEPDGWAAVRYVIMEHKPRKARAY